MAAARRQRRCGWRSLWGAACLVVALCTPGQAASSLVDAIESVQPRIVKIYGAGGFRGLEAYQSGFLISPVGHVMTVSSYVVDTDTITVTLSDGRRYSAMVLGRDPTLGLAVLKIDADGLLFFDLEEQPQAEPGTHVLAFSNLFGVATGDEPASVQHGIISAQTRLSARRGVFETLYRGPVLVIDAVTNNPGAAGGALTNRRGELIGMLGKELRNSLNNTWLNYAVPIDEMRQTIDQIMSGQFVPDDVVDAENRADDPVTLDVLGVVLVPNVVERTPPYVDEVRAGSPAAAVGLRPDDLILFVNGRLVQSCRGLLAELEQIERVAEVTLTVARDENLVEAVLQAPPE